jgi:DNA-binding CsgD family transcriptional regulator
VVLHSIPSGAQAVESLVSTHPLYTVDLEQNITSWDERASAALPAVGSMVGRRCYEVLSSIDPRNASLCRPNCPTVMEARVGRPTADFHLWTQSAEGAPGRLCVSILLQPGDSPQDRRILHMVRPVRERDPERSAAPVLRALSASADAMVYSLTPRQKHALCLLAEGFTPDEIAEGMQVRPVTVRNHIQAAMERLGARSRLEAVITASRAGLLDAAD